MKSKVGKAEQSLVDILQGNKDKALIAVLNQMTNILVEIQNKVDIAKSTHLQAEKSSLVAKVRSVKIEREALIKNLRKNLSSTEHDKKPITEEKLKY